MIVLVGHLVDRLVVLQTISLKVMELLAAYYVLEFLEEELEVIKVETDIMEPFTHQIISKESKPCFNFLFSLKQELPSPTFLYASS